VWIVGVLALRTSVVLPAVRAMESSPPRHPSAVIVPTVSDFCHSVHQLLSLVDLP